MNTLSRALITTLVLSIADTLITIVSTLSRALITAVNIRSRNVTTTTHPTLFRCLRDYRVQRRTPSSQFSQYVGRIVVVVTQYVRDAHQKTSQLDNYNVSTNVRNLRRHAYVRASRVYSSCARVYSTLQPRAPPLTRKYFLCAHAPRGRRTMLRVSK